MMVVRIVCSHFDHEYELSFLSICALHHSTFQGSMQAHRFVDTEFQVIAFGLWISQIVNFIGMQDSMKLMTEAGLSLLLFVF